MVASPVQSLKRGAAVSYTHLEVEQNPGRYATQVRDIVEHTDIIPIQTCLVFLTPRTDYILITGLTVQCFAAKFRDNQRFVRHYFPTGRRSYQ